MSRKFFNNPGSDNSLSNPDIQIKAKQAAFKGNSVKLRNQESQIVNNKNIVTPPAPPTTTTTPPVISNASTFTGLQGPQGYNGYGVQGLQGISGGGTGSQGFQGLDGLQGVIGFQGAEGTSNILNFDSTPTTSSSNPVTSNGIKVYVDTKVPAFYNIEGDLTSPSLFTYSLTNGYHSRYHQPNINTNSYSSIKIGDVIFNTHMSNIQMVYKVTQVPTFNNWDPIAGGQFDPDGAISIPSFIFDSYSVDNNGYPVLDPAWNSSGSTWQLGYVRVNGTYGTTFSAIDGFTESSHATGPCTIFGGYIYKDPNTTWMPASFHYSYITGLGPSYSIPPYVNIPSALFYYGDDNSSNPILVDHITYEGYEPNNSGEPIGLELLTSSLGGFDTISKGTTTLSGYTDGFTYSMPHGLGATPSYINVTAGSDDSGNFKYIDCDSLNIYVIYDTTPNTGVNNLKYWWLAEI